jgi:hypothetical protein
MKLSENTLSVLKNFASINSGVVLQKGKVQKTISPEQTILVEASLEDDMPVEFGIYDLNQFLGNVTTLANPEMTFATESVQMNDGSFNLNYYSCSPNLIISPPRDKDLVLKNPEVSFDIPAATLQKLLRLAAMNNLPHITVIGKNGKLTVRGHEKTNDTSNSADVAIGDYSGDDFSVSFKAENLKMVSDDYSVQIKIGGFSCWTNKKATMKYFIALEKK